MTDRLLAGPVLRVAGIAVIPILRIISAVSARSVAIGMIVPVAVLTVAGNDIQAWGMDGHPKSTREWLDAVPDLAGVVDWIRRSPEGPKEGR